MGTRAELSGGTISEPPTTYGGSYQPISHSGIIFNSVHPNSDTSVLAKMFFHGDLQSGIALAVRESKCVACFVRGLC